MSQKERIIEAILFAAGNRISVLRIQELAEISTQAQTIKHLKNIQKKYDDSQSPFEIIDLGEEWKFTVKSEFIPIVEKISPDTEFSKSVIETLSILAWKTPMLQSELIHIRSAKAYEHVQELLEKGFITKEKIGRSYIIKLTQKFYDYFDMDKRKIKESFEKFQNQDPLDQTKLDEDFEKIKETKLEEAKLQAELDEQKRIADIEELSAKPSVQELKEEEKKSQKDFLAKFEQDLLQAQERTQKTVSDLKNTAKESQPLQKEESDSDIESNDDVDEIVLEKDKNFS